MNKKQAGNEPNYAANDPTEFRKAMYDNVQQYKIPEKKPTNLSNGTGPSPQFGEYSVNRILFFIDDVKRMRKLT